MRYGQLPPRNEANLAVLRHVDEYRIPPPYALATSQRWSGLVNAKLVALVVVERCPTCDAVRRRAWKLTDAGLDFLNGDPS